MDPSTSEDADTGTCPACGDDIPFWDRFEPGWTELRPDLMLCGPCYTRRWLPLVHARFLPPGPVADYTSSGVWEPRVWRSLDPHGEPWSFGRLSERGRVLWDEFLESGGEGRPGPI